jgi:hypothetical protein
LYFFVLLHDMPPANKRPHHSCHTAAVSLVFLKAKLCVR